LLRLSFSPILVTVEGGVLAEYNNLRLLLSQLATEQVHAARVRSAAGQHELVAQWLTGLSAVLFALFAFVLWFEPRTTRATQSKRKILTGS
jgi:hypothetical protein